ncbi:hypothetical protein DY000_02032506 [Brassica cretica]|uniref:Secreted protein n=1 Tax=Brassica cretica TaxID=69181 RepID=A0ABQ7DYU5_BRACR|nr:hypothetical protein DY000_02032506 [Brassica cretica]
MTSAFLRGFPGFSFFFASLGLLFQSTSGVHNRLLLPPLVKADASSGFLQSLKVEELLTRSFGVCVVSTATVCSRPGSIDAHRLMVLLRQKTRSCGLLTARVISTASSLRRPVSGVSGESAASCSGDDSPVVVSMVWSTRVSRSLRVQHVLRVVDRVIDSIGLF